jgi:hypothetical protein
MKGEDEALKTLCHSPQAGAGTGPSFRQVCPPYFSTFPFPVIPCNNERWAILSKLII